jgi:hypothetical protein
MNLGEGLVDLQERIIRRALSQFTCLTSAGIREKLASLMATDILPIVPGTLAILPGDGSTINPDTANCEFRSDFGNTSFQNIGEGLVPLGTLAIASGETGYVSALDPRRPFFLHFNFWTYLYFPGTPRIPYPTFRNIQRRGGSADAVPPGHQHDFIIGTHLVGGCEQCGER